MANQLVVINVLDKKYYDDCHITGSINIAHTQFTAMIATLNKDHHYVVYCARYACSASSFCAKLLHDAGFEHVLAYEGGMAEWYQKGYPYQGPAVMDYLKGNNVQDTDHEHTDVVTITAEALLLKIKEHGLIA